MSQNLLKAREEQLKDVLDQIAQICITEEFQVLKRELEVMYRRCKVQDPAKLAFQDALYSLLIQQEDTNQIEYRSL